MLTIIIMVIVITFVISKTDENWINKHNEDGNYISNSSDIDYQNQNMNYFMDEMNRQQFQQFSDWSLEESRKSVTPFEQGGYDMNNGNSFNDMNNNNMNGF